MEAASISSIRAPGRIRPAAQRVHAVRVLDPHALTFCVIIGREVTVMTRCTLAMLLAGLLLLDRPASVIAQEFRDLFNGRDLAGWVNVNTADDTWRVEDGVLICSGRPIGVMRRARNNTRTSSCTSNGCTPNQGGTRASSSGATPIRTPSRGSLMASKCRCSNSTGRS